MKKAEIEGLLIDVQPKLLRNAYSLTKDTDKAYDLLQETNLKIILAYDSFNGSKKFKSWCFAIMRNTFYNNCKHEERLCSSDDIELYISEYVQAAESYRNDIRCNIKDIYNTLNALPAGHNMAIRLLIRGLKYKEIATYMESPIGTVKNRINLSRGILKNKLRDFLN